MEEQIVRLESGLMNCEYKIDELRSELRSMINELSEDLDDIQALDEAEFAGKVKELIFEARDSFPF